MLTLDLAPIDAHGIYATPTGLLRGEGRLHPEAVVALRAVEGFDSFIFSGLFRTAEQSLVAMRSKVGVQPPGYSAHNFGLAVDIALDDYDVPGTEHRGLPSKPGTLTRLGIQYGELLARMAAQGWHCHRRDRRVGGEAWHFNWLGSYATEALAMTLEVNPRTWEAAAEFVIWRRYGAWLVLNTVDVQTALQHLHLYKGDLDGQFGPRSREALAAFQRAWQLPDTGLPDARSQRVLAVVAAS